MNIDTLRNSDGTFRNAMYTDIVRCLNADHTTHLQTDRGTMAFRPCTVNAEDGFNVSRCVPGQQQQTKFFSGSDRNRIIRAALRFLNGSANSYWAHAAYAGRETT
jgi:hypothetical protein